MIALLLLLAGCRHCREDASDETPPKIPEISELSEEAFTDLVISSFAVTDDAYCGNYFGVIPGEEEGPWKRARYEIPNGSMTVLEKKYESFLQGRLMIEYRNPNEYAEGNAVSILYGMDGQFADEVPEDEDGIVGLGFEEDRWCEVSPIYYWQALLPFEGFNLFFWGWKADPEKYPELCGDDVSENEEGDYCFAHNSESPLRIAEGVIAVTEPECDTLDGLYNGLLDETCHLKNVAAAVAPRIE